MQILRAAEGSSVADNAAAKAPPPRTAPAVANLEAPLNKARTAAMASDGGGGGGAILSSNPKMVGPPRPRGAPFAGWAKFAISPLVAGGGRLFLVEKGRNVFKHFFYNNLNNFFI